MIDPRFERTQVTRADGTIAEARVEILKLAEELLAAKLASPEAGQDGDVRLEKLVGVFEANGLPGPSGNMASRLADSLTK